MKTNFENELPPKNFVIGKLYSLRPGDYDVYALNESINEWKKLRYAKGGANDIVTEDVEPVLIIAQHLTRYMAIGLLKGRPIAVHIFDVRDNL